MITDKAKNFITAHKDEPFFLYMVRKMYMFPACHIRVSPARVVWAYVATSSSSWTGPWVKSCTLGQPRIADNTIFVFCSDNGPVIDDGYQDQARELLNGHTPMKHYRGGKYSAFDAGTRIPFIVRWPNGINPANNKPPSP